jgi:hypothetical protein
MAWAGSDPSYKQGVEGPQGWRGRTRSSRGWASGWGRVREARAVVDWTERCRKLRCPKQRALRVAVLVAVCPCRKRPPLRGGMVTKRPRISKHRARFVRQQSIHVPERGGRQEGERREPRRGCVSAVIARMELGVGLGPRSWGAGRYIIVAAAAACASCTLQAVGESLGRAYWCWESQYPRWSCCAAELGTPERVASLNAVQGDENTSQRGGWER